MVGHSSITRRKEMANTVWPQDGFPRSFLNPMHDQTSGSDLEEADEGREVRDSWDAMARRYEELETRVAEQFEDKGGADRDAPPMIKSPAEPQRKNCKYTQQHTHAHIPYAAWCPHFVVARGVGRNHPAHGRTGKLVPDTEGGDGPAKVSLDYMYLHERIGKLRDIQHNPPYHVVIEHKHGSVGHIKCKTRV